MEEKIIWAILIVGMALCIVLHWWAGRDAHRAMRLQPWHIVPLAAVYMSIGYLGAVESLPQAFDVSQVNGKLQVAEVEEITYSDLSMRFVAQLQSNGEKVQLSLPEADYTLQEGDYVMFKAALQEAVNRGNPEEFDYVKQLRRKGVIYTQHCNTAPVIKVGANSGSLWVKIQRGRRAAVEKVLQSRFLTAESRQMLCAMVLGESRFVNKADRAQFSRAGLAHILALSGLHVTIITMLLWFALYPLNYYGHERWRLLISVLALVTFAVFTGLSASVVRAVIMAVVAMGAMAFYREYSPMNALGVAAFVTLAISPLAITDVGFQLSYVAVAAIMLMSQRLAPTTKSSHGLKHYFKALIVVATTAMIVTAPLSAYYFNVVPLLSVVSNLAITLLMPVLMISGVAEVVSLVIGIDAHWAAAVVNVAVDAVHWIASSVGDLKFASVAVYVEMITVVLAYLTIATAMIYVYVKKQKVLVVAIAFAVAMVTSHAVYRAMQPREGMVIFNNSRNFQMLYFDNGKALVWESKGYALKEEFEMEHKRLLAKYAVKDVRFVSDKEEHAGKAWFSSRRAYVMGETYAIAATGRWTKVTAREPLKVDYLVLTRQFHSKVKNALKLYRPRKVLISSDVYDKRAAQLARECEQLGIQCEYLRTRPTAIMRLR